MTVSLTAPGLDEVTGPVVVRIAGVVQQVDLRNGVAKVTLVGLPQGKRTLTVRFAGNEQVNQASAARVVRIG